MVVADEQHPKKQTTELERDEFEPQDDKICRICHGGESDIEFGRLISPCKCKGSIKYVHIQCLEQWRRVSSNHKSYFKCENCLYVYHFRRTFISKVLRNFFVLQLATALVLFFLIILGGYLWKIIEFMVLDDQDRHFESLWWIDLPHLVFGSCFVGLVGFMQLLFLLHGPLHLFNIGGNGRGNVETVVFAIMVIFGLIKAFTSLYKMVKEKTDSVFSRAEEMILEVQ